MLGFLIGCVGVVSHDNQPEGLERGAPRGLYAFTFHSRPTGSITGLLAAEQKSDGFRANSRPRVAGLLLGGFKGVYANLFGFAGLPAGVLVRWYGPEPRDDTPTRGTLCTPIRMFHADFDSTKRLIELRSRDTEECLALVTLEPARTGTYQATDFSRLTKEIEAVIKARLFDPELVQTRGMQAFLDHLRRVAKIARDDVEFWMGFQLATREIQFSHVGLYRELDPVMEKRIESLERDHAGKSIVVNEEDAIVTLRIADFFSESYDEIDEAFADIVRRDPRGLIIDLRGTPGGTYASLRVAAHLIESPVAAGVLFNRSARAKVLAQQLDGFPKISSLSSGDELSRLVEDHGAVVGWVEPVALGYTGPVAVLINAETASSAEPLVALLQETGRVVLVGEQTAGAMLLPESFEVGDGWKLVVPIVEYRTAEGVQLEGHGIRPHLQVKSADAHRVAREFLNSGE